MMVIGEILEVVRLVEVRPGNDELSCDGSRVGAYDGGIRGDKLDYGRVDGGGPRGDELGGHGL